MFCRSQESHPSMNSTMTDITISSMVYSTFPPSNRATNAPYMVHTLIPLTSSLKCNRPLAWKTFHNGTVTGSFVVAVPSLRRSKPIESHFYVILKRYQCHGLQASCTFTTAVINVSKTKTANPSVKFLFILHLF